MGLLDTFSKKFGFTTDDEDDNELGPDENEIEEEEDDEEEDEEDSGFSFRFPSNPFRRKNQASSSRRRSFAQDDEEEEPTPAQPARSSRNNVIHDPRMSHQAAEPVFTHCERIVNVRQIEECREIIKCLLRGESVLLNLENIDPKDCGRVVDLLSGAAFALQGRMLKVAHLSYLLAPENVEVIEGDVYGNPQTRYR